jgi:hypothetical protein
MSSFHRSDWLSVASPIVTLLIVAGGYYIAYFQEKGKNREAAEDIDKLTRVVESIKTENAAHLADIVHQNAVLIEQLKSQNQLRLAAVDRRLQAHQEAFALWRKLNQHLSADNLFEIIAECDRWWTHNCLYLEDDARDAFSDAYWNAHMCHQLERTEALQPNVRTRALQFRLDRMTKITEAGNRIAKAVALPGLSTVELEKAKENLTASRGG